MFEDKFCSNECDTEAVYFYVNSVGNKVYLCFPCACAFEWGQVNPDVLLVSVEDE